MTDNKNERYLFLGVGGGAVDEENQAERESVASSSVFTQDAPSEDAVVLPGQNIVPRAPQESDMFPSLPISLLSTIKKEEGQMVTENVVPRSTQAAVAALDKHELRSNVSTEASDPDSEGNPKKVDKTADERGIGTDDGLCAKRLMIILGTVFVIALVVGAVIVLSNLPNEDTTEPPVEQPTPRPTVPPGQETATPSATPTVSPTPSPTGSPTTHDLFELFAEWSGVDVLKDKSTPQSKAYEWMTGVDQLGITEEEAVKQRYSIATVFFGVSENDDEILPEEYQTTHECEWPTIVCNETTKELQGINLSPNAQYRSLAGTIPGKELSFLSTLTSIDISENNLRGQIPEELYSLTKLTGLYLHHNLLSGTISTRVGDLWSIRDIYLNHNKLSGSFPRELRSLQDIRPLRYLYLNNNQLTGSIPSSLRLRQLFLMDLSFNKMTGTIPEDFGLTAVQLWHLYLEHNQFTGQIPESIATVGNSRLIDLVVNDNQFTGSVPTEWSKGNTFMVTLRVHNNMFTEELDNDVCRLDVFSGGELVDLSADCAICTCRSFCDKCFIDGVRQGADPLSLDQLLP